jgi:hypothetical protein
MTTKKLKLKLSKFENVQIIYITPLGQYWGIFSNSIKKCIIKKKNIYLPVLEDFLLDKKVISYKNSKLFKKGVKFTFVSKEIRLATKKKNFSIEILSKEGGEKKLISTNLKFSELSLALSAKLTKKLKKNYGIFFTSKKLVNIILDRLKIILTKLNIKIMKVLEPSCGSGEFLLGLNEYFSKLTILGIEYNDTIYDSIKNF